MRTGNNLLWVLLLSASVPAFGQNRYSRVSIRIPAQRLSWLVSKGIAFDHGELNQADNTFITTLSSDQLAALKATGTAYSVLVPDETEAATRQYRKGDFYRNSNAVMLDGKLQFQQSCGSAIESVDVPAAFTEGSYAGYYTYNEMLAKIKYMVDTYPNLVDTIHLPIKTWENRTLIAVKISDNATTDENEPEALYTGLHHAREGMSMMNLFFFMNYLLEHYNTDARIKDLVDSRELYFIPCVNPDGYVYNETSSPSGGGMWRKNRRNNGSFNDRGVDLNRNYGEDWGEGGPNVSISTDPNSESYIGPSPWSEPETRAIRAFGQSRHFTIAIDHHAYGNYYVTPFGRPAQHAFSAQDSSFYTYASALMAKYNAYSAGDGLATVGYYAVGNSRDWYMIGDIGTGTKQKAYGYTVEIGPGNQGFWPDNNLIIPISKTMFFANIQMAYMAGSYFELQDLDPITFNNATGTHHFSVRRIGLTDAPVTVSFQPLENIIFTGSPVTISSMPQYFDVSDQSISYSLPAAITPGTRIRFLRHTVSAGITTTDTIVKYYQPIQLISEDMETVSNWQFSGNWGSTTRAAFEGSRSISESPAGNYSSSETSYATFRNGINLSDAASAHLVFRVRHRAQNGYDKLQVQLSDNGTANYQAVCATSTILESVGTINNTPAITGNRVIWNQEVIDLKDYLGNSNVRLRFGFFSNGSTTDDGFYIDNVELVKTKLTVLPVQFINVQAKKTVNGIQLSWETAADENIARFEIERAADGKEFTTIGTVTDHSDQFTDREPGAINHYRIRAVHHNQTGYYSRTVRVEYQTSVWVSVSPNPAAGELVIRYETPKATSFLLRITDVTGRQLVQQTLQSAGGTGYTALNISSWKPQIYIVTVKDLKSGNETVTKIIKK